MSSKLYSTIDDNQLASFLETEEGPARRVAISTGDTIVTQSNRLPIELNKSYVDAFQRLRVAEPVSILDSKNVNVIDDQFGEALTGAGTSSFDYDQSAVLLNLTTASGDKVLRRTHQYNSYSPGRSLEVFLTGKFETGKTNLIQKIGLYDNENGFFFQVSGSQISVVKRSSVSGSVVNTVVNQDNWNIDKMDGEGRSGKTLVYDKTNIYVVTYQWLGVGAVTLSVDIDGELQPVHQFYHASIEDSVYIRNPSLPVSFEIENTGVTDSPSTLKQICCNVNSTSLQGQNTNVFSVSNAGSLVSCGTGGAMILAVRPKLQYPALKTNRYTLDLSNVNIYTESQTIYWEARLYIFPSVIGGTWVEANTKSSAEFSVNPTFTGNYIAIDSGYAPAASQGNVNIRTVTSSGPGRNDKTQLHLNFDGSNRYVLALWARSLTSTAQVGSTFRWLEFN